MSCRILAQGGSWHPKVERPRLSKALALRNHPRRRCRRIRRDYRRDKAEQAQLDDAFNIDEPSFNEEDATAIRDALSRLGVKHREVLVLHFLQDLSILEIANVVGCSEGTVKSRIHYAKRQIKQILKGVKHGTTIE
jgi:RNA polymerase sigma-70 factor, ECF subfamily